MLWKSSNSSIVVKWYMKFFIYWTADMKSSELWSSQWWTQFKQLRKEAWKSQDFNGVWTRDLARSPQESTAQKLSFEWSHLGISPANSKVRVIIIIVLCIRQENGFVFYLRLSRQTPYYNDFGYYGSGYHRPRTGWGLGGSNWFGVNNSWSSNTGWSSGSSYRRSPSPPSTRTSSGKS